MTSVLFLDVDGVLNHRAIFQPSRQGSPLCPAAIRRLRAVVSVTGCRVVLSSTWRMLPHHVEQLHAAGGFPSPHDDWRTVELPLSVRKRTSAGKSILLPGVNAPRRGDEIAEWLSRHSEVERYAIVDDDDDMLPGQVPFFVQTSFDDGLLDHHAARLVNLLGIRAVPLAVLAALGRLNAHARSPRCGRMRRAIYDYKEFATFVLVGQGSASVRLVAWTGPCNRCTDGWFTHWEWRDGHKVRCRNCGGTGRRTLRFTEATLPDGQVWHHPWIIGHACGLEIARHAIPGLHSPTDADDSWHYCDAAGNRIEWHGVGEWRPNLPGAELERDDLVPLLNRVEDWLEGFSGPVSSQSGWVLESARNHLCRQSHRGVIGEPSHSYAIELGRARGGCFVCGSDDLAGYGYGRMTPLFHWSVPVCKRHGEGPDKAPFPKGPPPDSLLTPEIRRWQERHERVRENR